MFARTGVKIRSLPDGDFREALAAGMEGCLLKLELPGQKRDWPPRTLVEIESETMLYLGEVQSWSGPETAVVLVEHTLDRARLAAIQETWG